MRKELENEEGETAISRADDYLDMAMQATTMKEAKKNAKKALEVWPDCIDAAVFLTQCGSNVFESEQILVDAIKKEKRRLTRAGYFEEENVGRFYGLLDTRAYIRALYSQALYYASECKMKKAIEIGEEILRLNNNDNTGVRYLLMSLYAFLEDEEAFKKLYKKYNDNTLGSQVPGLMLYYKKSDYKKAKEYLDRINTYNKNFKDFFAKKMRQDEKILPGCYSVGQPSEVLTYLETCLFLLQPFSGIELFIKKDGLID